MANARENRVKCEESSSTRLILDALPHRPGLAVATDSMIDDARVAANRKSKLCGTFGETIVVFHDADSPLGCFIRTLQISITNHFRKVTQHHDTHCFSNEQCDPPHATDFAIIDNPHTTIIAMLVVDAVNESSWNEQLHIEQDILSRDHSTQTYSQIEPIIIDKLTHHPTIQLEIESIALTVNGSLGIKWKINDEFVALRQTLSSIGGIAKHGNDIITTTIGYFPYCKDECKKEIHDTLTEIICNEQVGFDHKLQFDIPINQSQLVKFSRNDLHPDFIHKSTLIAGEHLTVEISDTAFPTNLQHYPTH